MSSCGFINVPFQFYQFLLHIVSSSFVRFTYMQDCYVFVVNWPFYILLFLSISDRFFSLKSTLSVINIAISDSF